MAEQRANDSSDDLFLILAVVVIGTMAIYYFFGQQIRSFYLNIKLYELKLITLIYPKQTFLELIAYIENTPLKNWTIRDMGIVGKTVGYVVNVPIIIGLAFYTYKIWDRNPMQKFRRVLTMQTLKESEQKIWPYIAPVVNVNLMEEPFDKGPYSMALRPYDFSVKHKLLQNDKDVTSLDRVRSEKLFVSQLGKLWGGYGRLQPHEKALLAIFAAQACGQKKAALEAVNAIAISAASDQKRMPDFSSVKNLVKYIDDPKVQEIINKHAYVYTVMAQMLEFARSTGVLPTPYIVWLKPKDRTLWYVLNCVGRQVSFVEVAGIFGHWKAEQIAKHKLESPYVIKAVDGLEKALSEVKVASN